MRTVSLLTAWIMLGSIYAAASAPAQLGAKAEELDIREWIKGKPVKVSASEEDDRVYVVEFWATWCGPCRTSIPHLTKLQKKYDVDDVVVIGVSDEDPSKVRTFVDRMGEQMAYTVATDEARKTSTNYMRRFNQRGIPTAFVVQGGRVMWVGHPMAGLDDVVEKAVKGELDLSAVQKKEALRRAQERAMMLGSAYVGLVAAGDDEAAAKKKGEEFLEAAKDSPRVLSMVAWTIMDNASLKIRDLDLANRAVQRAVQLEPENPDFLDTAARAEFERGNVAEAVKLQEKAVKLAKEQKINGLLPELEERLAKYRGS